jgi:hypothetical protein
MEGVIRSRVTIRRAGMSARGARLIEPWTFPENQHPTTISASLNLRRTNTGRPPKH